MGRTELMAAVARGQVRFATFRPANSPFATLERRVVVLDPPELSELARLGDVETLAELIELLRDRRTAWPAQVILAAMTGREEKLVESFDGRLDYWWQTVGKDAYERWSAWFTRSRDRLEWDTSEHVFVESQGDTST